MKILALSDNHGSFYSLKQLSEMCGVEDITKEGISCILHAGDLTNFGLQEPKQVIEAMNWLKELSNEIAPVYVTTGNHDIMMGSIRVTPIGGHQVRLITDGHSVYYGSTVGSTFDVMECILGLNMSPCYDMPDLAQKWERMTAREEVEQAYYDQFHPTYKISKIWVSHCPPYSELSEVGKKHANSGGKPNNIGSKPLLDKILQYQPRLVICGHVHGRGGREIMIGETRVVNVATTAKIIKI